MSGIGFLHARHLFRRSLSHNAAAALAAFRAKIDDPVRLFDHVKVVLDNQDRIPKFDQTLKHVQQFTHVVEVQSCCGFIEDVDRSARLTLGEFASQFNALRFASRKRRGGLTQLHVAKTDFDYGGQLLLNLRNVLQQLSGHRSRGNSTRR